MQHRLKLTKSERIKRWLELCDFTYNLMRKALTPGEFKKKLTRIREKHLERDFRRLENLGKIR